VVHLKQMHIILTQDGPPPNIEELRGLSRQGISLLRSLAVIASEDELCGETNRMGVIDEQMTEATFWRKVREIFGRLFG
jgi:hypothetical protein